MNADVWRRRVAAAALALVLAPAAGAQGAEWLRANYRKLEAQVPMRDGVRLFTAAYLPRAPGPHPILLHRTCYGIGPYGPDAWPEDLGPSAAMAREGYIFVYQDVRGKMMSEGTFQEMTPLRDGRGVDEATDAWDTIDWALKHLPGHNGRVGAWGISYPGFYAACALVGAHPALRAVSPQAPMADLFAGDDDHHNGALFLAQTFWFDAANGFPRPGPTAKEPRDTVSPGQPDDYRFFLDLGALPHADEHYFHGQVRVWSDEMAHGTDDGYWQVRDLRPHLRAIRPEVLTVGGWFDAEDLFGTLQVHRRVAAAAPGRSYLVMGPWAHGGWTWEEGDRLDGADFGASTAAFFRERVEAPFFRRYLKDGPDPALPRALVYETGTNRWRTFDAWPPRSARPVPLYFREGRRLDFRPPRARAGADRFVSDPARPVPYTAAAGSRVAPEFMVEDQRFAAARPDVLTYRTRPLEAPITLAGPLQARLRVAVGGTDADWVVKVIDEYPPAGPDAGVQRLVRAEVMRGKFRRSLARPEPFVPGRPTAVAFTLNDVCHTFRAGHRLVVQVQGSWFPLVDRNPGVFTDIYHARDEDFRPVEQSLYRDRERPSCLVVPVLK
jgi:hypothetical protein